VFAFACKRARRALSSVMISIQKFVQCVVEIVGFRWEMESLMDFLRHSRLTRRSAFTFTSATQNPPRLLRELQSGTGHVVGHMYAYIRMYFTHTFVREMHTQ
jgi:hypothetical protein